MNADANPHEELRVAIDGLTEEQARTLLGWVRVLRRERGGREGAQSIGPLGDVLGIVSEAREPGHTRLRLSVDPAWYNPNGVLHGGVIYSMVDSGMGSAVSSALGEGESCASVGVTINYLAPVREGTLTAETEVVKQGRNIAFAESKVIDDRGRLVATASGSMFIIRPDGRASARSGSQE